MGGAGRVGDSDGRAVPAAATEKMIVVDSETALVYPLEDGRLGHANRRSFANNRKGVCLEAISAPSGSLRRLLINAQIFITPMAIRSVRGEKGAQMRYWMRAGWTAQGFHHRRSFARAAAAAVPRGVTASPRAAREWLFNWPR